MSVNVTISKRLTLINSASSIGAMLLNSAMAVWLQQYLLKRISADEYSLIAVLSAVMVFLPLLTTILTSGIGRYVVEAFAKNDIERVTQIVSTMFPLLVVAAFFVAFIGYFAVQYINIIVKISPSQISNSRVMLAIMMLSFVVRLLLAPFGIGLYIQQKFVLENLINFGSILLRILILYILLFFISTNVVWVIAAQTFSDLFGLFLITLISHRQVPALRVKIREFRFSLIHTLVTFGWWNVIGQFGSLIRSAADPLILNRFATPVDVTCFHLGSLPDRLIRQVMSTAINPILPQLTALHATDRKDRIASVFLRLGRLSLWATMIMISPLLIYRKELFQVYLQEKFSSYSSVPLVMALLLAYLPIAYSITGLNYIIVATAKNKAFMIITALSQSLNLLLTFYFVGFLHLGAVGSALGTFIAGSIVTIFGFFPLSFKIVNITMPDFIKETILPGIIPWVGAAVVWIILKGLIHPSNWIALGCCVFLGMIVYIIILFIWCLQPVDRADLQIIMKTIKVKLWKY